jgi:ribosomal protein S18 acetylase RimI-like enzyme
MYAASVARMLEGMTEVRGAVVVRPVGREDVSAFAELLRQLDEETTFLAWEPGERDLDVSTLERHLSSPGDDQTCRLVAVVGERLVGFLVAHRGPTRRLRHRADLAMGVLLAYQRRGAGSGLVRALSAWAQAQRIVRIELTVMADNTPALSFYHRHGFVEEGLKRGSIRVDGRDVDEVLLGRLDGDEDIRTAGHQRERDEVQHFVHTDRSIPIASGLDT